MDWQAWVISPAVTLLGIGAVGWLARNWITARLTRSIQHEYDLKLVRAQAAIDERHSLLREQVESVRDVLSGPLSVAAKRKEMLFERRLAAIDSLLDAVGILDKSSAAVGLAVALKFDEIDKKIEDSKSGLQDFLKVISAGVDLESLKLISVNRARVYLTPACWSTYEAYKGVVVGVSLRIKIGEIGLPAGQYLKEDSLIELLKSTLPEDADLIDKHGINAAAALSTKIRDKIYSEIDLMLSDIADGHAHVTEAAELSRLADVVIGATGGIELDHDK